MVAEELYKIYLQHPSVKTDSRKLKPGDIFFALKGPSFNGNSFAQNAIDAGAVYAIIDEKKYEMAGKTILVDDVLTALQQLATHHRKQFTIPFIAITGSNGKTTTRELIHAVLSTAYKTATTEGNLNNHIGVPLTILKIKRDTAIAVIEMGANHLKEIESYCKIALPTHGIITNCGKAHLEGFGSEEVVRKAKGELFDHLKNLTHGFAFVMWDYPYLREMSKGISGIIKYGTKDAHVMGRVLRNDPFLQVEITQGLDDRFISTQLIGEYNLPNVLAAVTVGKFFNIPEVDIKAAIENYIPCNSRSQLIQKGSNKIILDAYNANPSSMKLAIENFATLQAKDKVLMLGGMAELGEESIKEHQLLLELINIYTWKDVVLVGGDFLKIRHQWHSFDNYLKAKEWFRQQNFENTYFLVKGSRNIEMEKVLEE